MGEKYFKLKNQPLFFAVNQNTLEIEFRYAHLEIILRILTY